jgi:predicted secreted Zn-dependent protease
MQWSCFTRSNRPAKWTIHINVIDHHNGDFGVHLSYMKAWIQEAGSDLKDDATCEHTKNVIRRVCGEVLLAQV